MIENISGVEANFNLNNINKEQRKEAKKTEPETTPEKNNVVPLNVSSKTTTPDEPKITNSQEASDLPASLKQDILSNVEASANSHKPAPQDNSLDMLI